MIFFNEFELVCRMWVLVYEMYVLVYGVFLGGGELG
jgi:hypothetical protein